MQTMRESWTDERLDEFSTHVDRRFDAVEQRFDAVDQRFDAVEQRFDAVDKRLDRIEDRIEQGFARFDGRLDAIQRSMFHGVIVLTGGMLAGFGGILVLIATQL
jgi:DNA anti-recombination protein RmuC